MMPSNWSAPFTLPLQRWGRLVLHAYLDDGGTFERASLTDTLYLSGFVADDPAWAAFHGPWGTLLRKHGLDTLHTTDFMAGKTDNSNARRSNEQRTSILREFVAMATNHAAFGVSVGVDRTSYLNVFSDPR